MRWFLLTFCLLIGSAWTVHARNLLSNPNFETGFAGGWRLQAETGSAMADWASPIAYAGNHALRVTVKQIGAENWKIQLQLPRFAVHKNALYTLQFHARSPEPRSVHVAVQKGASGRYAYLRGMDVNLTAEWKRYTMTHRAAEDGHAAFVWNIYVGGATGIYDFDDFVVTEEKGVLPASLVLPATGALQTGKYRNLFREMGKSDTEIDARVEAMFRQLFVNDHAEERLYWDLNAYEGYVKAIDSDDVRSEGISYAMMIAVQLDRQELFDKLWRFACKRMRHASGPRQGVFAWQVWVKDSLVVVADSNSAPDGEEYFAMALLFAEARWGNGAGILNYGREARALLNRILRLEALNKEKINGLSNFFDQRARQVVFVPQGSNALYTDPSYHLPAFYRVWAQVVPADRALWNAIADTSAAFLLRAQHSVSGLVTDYMSFAGMPQETSFNPLSASFAYDSWRVVMNVGMSAHWEGASDWHRQFCRRWLTFFRNQGSGYKSLFHWDGSAIAYNNYPNEALLAMNAVGVLASDNVDDWQFVQDLWNTPLATGKYRYYKGLLQMLAWLHCSGKFVAWIP